ncbi:acyl-CoA carboxylase subunit epsilon [Nocardia sp. XZ_19_385]|uniref:acyl-CoA carboxylase subunit epsilon n=1 Tax=Nocardia sp. XZ_19_385 TaxID=2769488 RepID=UPI00188F752C|nr:acyl-CoA carboxylase subunit epsilon [Nocardia sp. XZ_19_385]
MTTVAEEDVLTAVELDLTVEEIANEAEVTADAAAETPAAADQSLFRIVKGSPTDAEVAALVCVLTAAANSGGVADSGPQDMWGRPTMLHRGTSPFSPYAYPQLSHLR